MSDRQNRRNYYRILHVQPDAPAAILKSSYRALMRHLEMHPDRGGDHWNASLVNEAYEVLSDPERRAAYDETIDPVQVVRGRPGDSRTDSDTAADSGGSGASGATTPSEAETSTSTSTDANADGTNTTGTNAAGADSTGTNSAETSGASRFRRPAQAHSFDRTANVHEVEHSECLFCGSRYAMTVASPPSIVCAQCKSPMTLAGAPVLDDPGRRAARRIEREGTLRFYEEWPQDAGSQGRIADLSPVGMQFIARTPVEQYQIIKLEGPLLDAVASVANCRPTDDLYAIGVRFHTVRFNQAKGTFLSIEA